MSTKYDINKALPASSGIYWAVSEQTKGTYVLMHYNGYNRAWRYINGLNESEMSINLAAAFSPDFWIPVEPPEDNSEKEIKSQIDEIIPLLEKLPDTVKDPILDIFKAMRACL